MIHTAKGGVGRRSIQWGSGFGPGIWAWEMQHKNASLMLKRLCWVFMSSGATRPVHKSTDLLHCHILQLALYG